MTAKQNPSMVVAPAYRAFPSSAIGAGPGSFWLSPETSDPLWDEFLRATSLGQYQQSSLWAEYKGGEGWQHRRVVVTNEAGIIGGFQMLWKKKGPVRIGYITKGPVMTGTSSELPAALIRLMIDATRDLGLSALIVQPPDDDRVFVPLCLDAGFFASNPMQVIEATYLVDLQADMETLRARMSASLRRNLRKAKKRPSVVRSGDIEDLGTFFRLMAATCSRQKTTPNPGSVASLRRLWEIFSKTGSIRLSLVECEGHVPAAKLSLCFGDRLTVWKKGWNGEYSEWHPNELLEDDALEWGRNNGYRICDFCSFSTEATELMLRGNPLPENTLSTRDEYHLRFGGTPKLLPRSLLLLPNRGLQWLYRQTYHRFELNRQIRPKG